MIVGDRPTKAMVVEGNEIATHLFDAALQKDMGGLGGCKHFELQWFPKRFHDLITAYLADEIDSVEAIFIAMDRMSQVPREDDHEQ